MDKYLKKLFDEISFEYNISWEKVDLINFSFNERLNIYTLELNSISFIKQSAINSLKNCLETYFTESEIRILIDNKFINERDYKTYFISLIEASDTLNKNFQLADFLKFENETFYLELELEAYENYKKYEDELNNFLKKEKSIFKVVIKKLPSKSILEKENTIIKNNLIQEAIREKQLKKINESPITEAKITNTYNYQLYASEINESVTHDLETLKELSLDEVHKVCLVGKVFNWEIKKIRSGSNLLSFSLIDDKYNAISCKTFISKVAKDLEIINKIENNACIKVLGNWELEASTEKYQNTEPVLNVKKFAIIKPEVKPVSDFERSEIRIHTKMSAFDGVGDIKDYFDKAVEENIRYLAFTDINSVQSFPAIQQVAKNYPQIKVIYGVEMEVIEDYKIENNINIDSYVVFDLETTGFYPNVNEIIEFGAIKIKNNEIIAQKQFFVKPNKPIPHHITKITNISNEMVKNGLTIQKAYEEIKAFIGECPLFAHNGYSFDYRFLEILYEKNNDKIKNAIFDTIAIFKKYKDILKFKKFRLGSICDTLKVPYTEEAHRADYDAKVLYECLQRTQEILAKEYGPNWFYENYLKEVFALQKINNYGYQTLFFAKNKEGLKNLYNLVSIAHTKNFNEKPVLYWHDIENNKNSLLLAATTYRGIAWEAATYFTEDKIIKTFEKYDFIELSSPTCYLQQIDKGQIENISQVKNILKKIYEFAKKVNKPVIASSNAFYINAVDKIIREIIINTKLIGGKLHYLFDFNSSIIPDAHILSYEEIYKNFDFLSKNEIHSIWKENSFAIFSGFDLDKPLTNKLYPPKLEADSAKKIEEIISKKIHAVYGDNLNIIIKERQRFELEKLNKYDFNDIYYIAHLLVEESLKNGFLVGSRGSVGSSFIAWALSITEVNPLVPHYICPNCKYHEFVDSNVYKSGFDLKNKQCEKCSSSMYGDGHNIPFETFLGFEGDKIPDIDLNFASDYQDKAHEYTKVLFGKDNVFRAGTIATVASKTAYGFVMKFLESKNLKHKYNKAQISLLSAKCEGIKRTTGQHPGGIIIVPKNKSILDFSPFNYPADEVNSNWLTTHLEFEALHDSLLKLDILGHVDPQALKMLKELTKIDPLSISMNDDNVMQLFTDKNIFYKEAIFDNETTGAVGIPEFGTFFVRSMLKRTKPTKFSELVQISGLSHGTDVWSNNADLLIKNGLTLNDVISCRDDIMTYLMQKGIDGLQAFDIMEKVRKGKGLKTNDINLMQNHNVPSWYIESCQKIKYMFPKAHAIAYTIMAWRLAWYKLNYPLEFYAVYFETRCEQYEVETLFKGIDKVKEKFTSLKDKYNKNTITPKESQILLSYEAILEMYARGYSLEKYDLTKADELQFKINYQNKSLILPLIAVDGIGITVAKNIQKAKQEKQFVSLEDFIERSGINKTQLANLKEYGFINFQE